MDRINKLFFNRAKNIIWRLVHFIIVSFKKLFSIEVEEISLNQEHFLTVYLQQAQAFSDRYNDLIPPDKQKILKAFIHILDQGYLQRRVTLLRHDILRGKVVQNIGMLLGL
jgi:hypothetical protein